MKKVLCAMISCLILLSGLVIFENAPKAKTSTSTQNNKLDSLKSYKQKAEFIFLVETKLKEEGYNSAIVRMLYVDKGNREITIEISDSEYKGKQTKDKINESINHIAEENHLGSIVVILKGIS